MKQTILKVIPFFLTLAVCACEAGGGTGETSGFNSVTDAVLKERDTPTAAVTAVTDETSSTDETHLPAENIWGFAGAVNMSITLNTQEYYENGDIVEIPYFEYTGEKNEVIDSINRLFNQGLQMRYEEFDERRSSYETMEIKTYPFTDEQYSQVVVSSVIYNFNPDYTWAGELQSVNYDKLNNKWIQFSDLGIDENNIIDEVSRLYMQENKNDVIDGVKVTGFLLRPQNGSIAEFTEILLEITVNGGNDVSFYSYCSGTDEFFLFEPSKAVPFSHNDMDRMDPPLLYDTIDEGEGYMPITDGIIYTGSVYKINHGNNMSPYEAASGLYYRLFHEDYIYSGENRVFIQCVDLVEIDGLKCYSFSVSGYFGNDSDITYAVSWNYDNQSVYEVSGGVSRIIGSILDLGSAKAYWE